LLHLHAQDAGGALVLTAAAASSSIHLTGNTFQSNSAGWQGGAVAVYAGITMATSVRLTGNNSFTHNTAVKHGGALFIDASNATRAAIYIGGSALFLRNTAARSGGAVAVWLYDATQSNVTVTGAILDGNVASNTDPDVLCSGGGLAIYDASTVVVQSCTFNNNSAPYVSHLRQCVGHVACA
jgi:predicted outer membrane repeat protein